MKNRRLLPLTFIVFCSVAAVSFAEPNTPNVPAGHPKIEYPAQSTTHQQSEPISGKVLQVLNSGGYSYIYLQKGNGEKIWIAVTQTRAKEGDRMSFKEGLVMKNFESKTLKRTFDTIVFSNGVVPQPAGAPASSPAKAATPITPPTAAPPQKQTSPMGSKVAVMPKEKRISVKKAVGPNAFTIAEIYHNRAKLDKKQIVVRGKIVKVTSGIMKRIWVHIQDGTGSQSKGTHNLVCTTTATPHLDDVVTVKGTVAKDRDFGYGYRYKVLIENATISK
jgi:hypothetical protein